MLEDRRALEKSHAWHLDVLRLRWALGRGLAGLSEVEDRAEGRVGAASGACRSWGSVSGGVNPTSPA